LKAVFDMAKKFWNVLRDDLM